MSTPPEQYVLCESVLLRAILDPDSAAADVLTHLMRSPNERAVVPSEVATRFLGAAATGIVVEAPRVEPPIEEYVIPGHLVARWLAAHAKLMTATVPPPAQTLERSRTLRPSLEVVVATAIDVGADFVISEYSVRDAFQPTVIVMTSVQFFDHIDGADVETPS